MPHASNFNGCHSIVLAGRLTLSTNRVYSECDTSESSICPMGVGFPDGSPRRCVEPTLCPTLRLNVRTCAVAVRKAVQYRTVTVLQYTEKGNKFPMASCMILYTVVQYSTVPAQLRLAGVLYTLIVRYADLRSSCRRPHPQSLRHILAYPTIEYSTYLLAVANG